MIYPDLEKPFVLVVDASDKQIGAALLQAVQQILHPVYYLSRTLDVHEQRYSVPEKECLALVWAIKHFRHYLHGKKFIVRTDHRCLVWLMRHKDPTSKLMKWILQLQEYDFMVLYGKGDSNVIADTLSRLDFSQPLPVNDCKEFLNQELPSAICLPVTSFRNVSQTKTAGPRHENWLGRTVQVVGDYFGSAYAKLNKISTKRFNLKVVEFKEGSTLRKDRWIVQLAPEDGGESFEMSYSAMMKYLLPTTTASNSDPTATTTTSDSSQAQLSTDAPGLSSQQDCIDFPRTEELLSAQRSDPLFSFWYTWLQTQQAPAKDSSSYSWWSTDKDNIYSGPDDFWCCVSHTFSSTRTTPCKQILVPTVLTDRVMFLFHGKSLYGHQGVTKTLFLMRNFVYWPSMRVDVTAFIKRCTCQGVKYKTPQITSFTGTLTSSWPNDVVAIDCTGPLPQSSAGHRYIIVMQDHFTKWVVATSTDCINASTICDFVYRHWILIFGPMRCLLSDRGREFKNHELQQGLCDTLGVKKLFTTACILKAVASLSVLCEPLKFC